jgi:hypothetical protein
LIGKRSPSISKGAFLLQESANQPNPLDCDAKSVARDDGFLQITIAPKLYGHFVKKRILSQQSLDRSAGLPRTDTRDIDNPLFSDDWNPSPHCATYDGKPWYFDFPASEHESIFHHNVGKMLAFVSIS